MAGPAIERPVLKEMAAGLRDDFNTIADELDVHVKNINIARVVGGTTGIAGGVVAIVGFALIPFTMGASAVVAAVGGSIVGALGGATAGGASVAKFILEQNKTKGAIEKWSSFCKAFTDTLKQDTETFQRLKTKLGTKLLRMGLVSAEIAKDAVGLGVRGARAGTAAGSTAPRLMAMAAGGSILLNLALLGFSLYDIIDGSLKLSRGNGSKVGSFLRAQAQILDEFAHGRGSLAKALDGYVSDEG